MNTKIKTVVKVLVIIFAVIGFMFTGVFIAMQFGLLNVRGTISERNAFFDKGNKNIPTPQKSSEQNEINEEDYSCLDKTKESCEWNQTREWEVVKGGLIKDKDIILEVSKKTDISPRLLVSIVIPEQTRFFSSEREVFKRYFEPLKILGSLTKFSLGVSGIKQETAMKIENYASDPKSHFYPGKKYSELIAYNDGVNHDSELYKRLTDSKNHYYSYLYTAIFVKEIEAQWKVDGYNIMKTPGAVITLFNLGFSKSQPNPIPHLGGAEITTGGKNYSYGELGLTFYNSNELIDIFQK